ncbi:J domain-containing protein [Granulosicoccaceae sp. 1_MG-2023]|nr:J domain-containing protein [Granulosicoccaceae sp. 1_MG-2023]
MTTEYNECYDRLELPRNADFRQARLQYKKLTQRWHPDRHQGEDSAVAHEQFRAVRAAFESLKAFHSKNQRLPFEPEQLDDSAFESARVEVARREHTVARQRRRRKTKRAPVSRLSYVLGFLIIAFLIYSSTTKKSDYVGGDIFDPPSGGGAAAPAQSGSSSGRRAPLLGGSDSDSFGHSLNRKLFGN